MSLAEAANAVGGVLVYGGEQVEVNSISTDSRTLQPGDLFCALRGERHDAHDYLDAAVEAGAAALLVEKCNKRFPVPVIKVDDTLNALQDLAYYNRQQFNVPVIGITGSSGKTTTKDMVASVLAQKYRVLKTEGNFNNEIGLPLTLLKMDHTHQAVVLEMAMRGPGEIEFLCNIAAPTAAVITNVGEAHLERLGSVENIARAKAEILGHIPASGFAALHYESPYLAGEASRCRGKVIFFGWNGCDVRARDVRQVKNGSKFKVVYRQEEAEMLVPLPGRHNVLNALAAIIAGRELGLSFAAIARGLSEVSLSPMRMEIIRLDQLTIINDAYNANPSSTKAALQALKEVAGRCRAVAVLGDMLELGSGSREGHAGVGLAAASAGVGCLVTVGSQAQEIARAAIEAGMPAENVNTCQDNQEALQVLRQVLKPGDVVLVKGSRGVQMEEIVAGLAGRK